MDWAIGKQFAGAVERCARGLVAPADAVCGSIFCFSVGRRVLSRDVSRRDGACHAGEARARAASARRIAARRQSRAAGQADAMAILTRRTLMRTSAPTLSSLRRMVPQVACANAVSCRPIRRRAHSSELWRRLGDEVDQAAW